MKKRIFVLSAILISASIGAATYFNGTAPGKKYFESTRVEKGNCSVQESDEKEYTEYFYKIGSRFESVQKSALKKFNSVGHILSPEYVDLLQSCRSTEIIIIVDEQLSKERMHAEGPYFSSEQRAFFENVPYATHFRIDADITATNPKTKELENLMASPHFTVVPESPAYYKDGEKEFIDYIAAGNKENTANLDEKNTSFGEVYLIVKKDGTLENVHIYRSSKNEKMDATMLELVKSAPAGWEPARDEEGNTVDQELVVMFALDGC